MINGIFIPGITERMFRDCPLEAIEKFRAKGEVIEIEYNPVLQRILEQMRTAESVSQLNEIHNLAKRQIFELWLIRCDELRRRKNERQENDRKDHRIPETDS